jgi:hypothetical protein
MKQHELISQSNDFSFCFRMPGLLSIPVEVREQILANVILEERKQPTFGSLVTSTMVPRREVANVTSLLLTSHRLYHETRALLKRLFPNGVTYKLDIIFVNNKTIRPTWLHVPAFTRWIENLEISVRCYDFSVPEAQNLHCTGQDAMLWCFCFLLEFIIMLGAELAFSWTNSITAATGPRAGPGSPHHAIGIVKFNFTPGHRERSRTEGYTRYVHRLIDPQECCLRAWNHIYTILQMKGRHLFHGGLFHATIDRFQFRCCNEQVGEIDVGAHLATLDRRLSPRECNCEQCVRSACLLMFWTEKYRAVQRRRKLGMTLTDYVLWPSFWEVMTWRESAREIAGDSAYNKAWDNVEKCLDDHGLLDALSPSLSQINCPEDHSQLEAWSPSRIQPVSVHEVSVEDQGVLDSFNQFWTDLDSNDDIDKFVAQASQYRYFSDSRSCFPVYYVSTKYGFVPT